MSNQPKRPTSFSEPEALRILNRATELEDTVGKRFTVDDLRQIAVTAGIDADALEHALNESARVPQQQGGMSSIIDSNRLVMLAGAGALLGGLAVVADNAGFGAGSAAAVFAPSGLYAAWLALRHPLRNGMPALLKELAIAFGAFTAVIVTMGGAEGLAPAVAWSSLCGMVGAGIVSLRGGTRATTPVPTDAR
jgi:hypothetical protein